MGESWTIKTEIHKAAFFKHVSDLLEEHGCVTYAKPRIGEDRSLSQNSLLHVWCTEYCAYLLKKDKRMLTDAELEGMKRIVKCRYYNYSGDRFMVHEIINPFNGNTKRDYTSSAKWKKGEMFRVLTWLQMTAANDGLVLESKGEFSKLQREQEAA